MKLRLPRGRFLRAAIYVASLVLVLLAADVILVEVRRTIHPGFDTTRITEPVLPDGSIDYLTAIETYFADGITPENNAAPLILQALGREALPKNQPPDGITDRLGMPHLPQDGDYYISYEGYCDQHHLTPREYDPSEMAGLPADIGPQTQQWIKAINKPLAMLAEASKRSRYFIPFNGGHRPQTLIEVLIPHVGLLHHVPRAFFARAILRFQAGDYQGFHEDLMTVHRLARLMSQSSTMIERIVAADSLETPACRIERRAAATGKLPARLAQSWAAELASLGDLDSVNDAVNVGERFMILDVSQAMARMGPTWAGEFINSGLTRPSPIADIEPAILFHLIPIPYEASMRTMNHFYDSEMAAMQLRSYPRRIAALRLWEEQVNQSSRHNSVLILTTPDWPAPVLLPAMMKAAQRAESARMEARLTQVALALAAYAADRAGAYPETLEALSPQYLSVLPMDSFSEKPLIYARAAAGYTLYSVGPNMIDDGGSRSQGDDLVASVP